jgi:hypothetical protein
MALMQAPFLECVHSAVVDVKLMCWELIVLKRQTINQLDPDKPADVIALIEGALLGHQARYAMVVGAF